MNRTEFLETRRAFEEAADQLTTEWQKTKKPVKASFPKGYIRKLGDLKDRWPYLKRERQRTVACVIQLCDINRWNLNIWEIGLTAGTLSEWHHTLPVIAVVETIIRELALQQGWVKEEAPFKKCINVMNSKGLIKQELCDRLHKLREYRNNIHLYLRDTVEMHDGKPRRYNNAVNTLHELERILRDHWEQTVAETKSRGRLIS